MGEASTLKIRRLDENGKNIKKHHGAVKKIS